jgi:hypothetical protein
VLSSFWLGLLLMTRDGDDDDDDDVDVLPLDWFLETIDTHPKARSVSQHVESTQTASMTTHRQVVLAARRSSALRPSWASHLTNHIKGWLVCN